MLQFRHSKCSNPARGFAPIWIILLLFLLGVIVFFARGSFKGFISNQDGNTPAKTVVSSPKPAASPESAKIKQQSLFDLCKTEILNLPKLPFIYEKITPTGSNAELYRKDRIKDKKNFRDFATCGLSYSTVNVIEKTYASMGLQYYKTDGKSRWGNYTDIKQMPKNIDNVYGKILEKQGWTRQTKMGGENLGYGLPTLIFYKDMGDKNYYIDVVVGPDPASLYLLIVNK